MTSLPRVASVQSSSLPCGPPTGDENGIAHSDSSSRIVILNEVKNLLVGVSVGATDAATPCSIYENLPQSPLFSRSKYSTNVLSALHYILCYDWNMSTP